jgi:hypothetical protein
MSPRTNESTNPTEYTLMRKFLLASVFSLAALTPLGAVLAQPALQSVPGITQCGVLKGANFNITTDQAITISPPSATYVLNNMRVSNPSISMTTAAGGVYTAASKGGLAVIPASTTYTGLTTSAANTAGATASTNGATAQLTAATLYLNLTTAQGAAATADVYLFCVPQP